MNAHARQAGELAVSRKLSHFVRLSAEDVSALEKVVGERVHRYGPREHAAHQGDKPDCYMVLISGWACRYKVLEDGRRQIVGILLPGDLCDYGSILMRRLDHSVAALTPLACSRIAPEVFEELSRNHPLVGRAFLIDTLATLSIQREWAVNLGQRDAYERMAHLFCELFFRLRAVGLTSENSCEWPLTQVDFGDVLGISSIHVNRTMQELRARDLVKIGGKSLTIRDVSALQVAALFSPEYLHL